MNKNMNKIAFVGFGEVNTPVDIIIKKCETAEKALENEGLELISVYPVTDDYEEKDIETALNKLANTDFDLLVLCIAGWIPTHAVIKIAEQYRHKPMVLWGLCGWLEDGRIITTADQAGTSALRKTMADLGYKFKYIYDIIGKPPKSKKVAEFAKAAFTAARLRSSKIGMGGYRDMHLYGTTCDIPSLKRVTGIEIESFELLEIFQRYNKIREDEKSGVINNAMSHWQFLKEPKRESLMAASGYYLAVKQIIDERKYGAISIKDVDGMKKLLGFPPAPVFMLLADCAEVCSIPENDCLGSATQLMIKYLTGQCGAYLEFYEFFEDGVLAGVPDFVPEEITDGGVKVLPAAFGALSEGILNVSKLKTGLLTMCRLIYTDGKYYMHMIKGDGKTPRAWEEAGWTQPAPQLPGLEIILDNVEDFAQNVMSQHYIISYGDNIQIIKDLCDILNIQVV